VRGWTRRHRVAVFVSKRIMSGIVLVFVVSLLVFLAMNVLPGDPVAALLGRAASPQRAAFVREQLGLSRPLPQRYVHWLSHAVRGDLGQSLTSGTSVSGLILPRLRNTLILAIVTSLVMFPLGFLFGALGGAKRGGRFDSVSSIGALALLSLPEFVAGTLLIYILGIRFHLFPPVSLFSPQAGPLSDPATLVLPMLTLALVNFGYTFRFVRSAVAETMGSEYVRQARLNGFGEGTVVFRYSLRNALAPVVQMSSLVFLSLVAGVVITESVFSYPGIGLLAVNAAISRDFTTMVGVAVIVAIIYVIVNLITDIIIIMTNPKTRAEL